MNKLTFEIQTHKDFYKKLTEEYKEFLSEPLSSRHAINFSLTAFHLIEWIYHDYLSNYLESLDKFRADIKSKCPDIQIAHDIATGSKHYKLTTHKPKAKQTVLKEGGYTSGFSLGFNSPYLKIEMKDGRNLDFEGVAKRIMTFWDDYYK